MVNGIDAKFMRTFQEGRIDKTKLALHSMRFGYEIEADLGMKGLLPDEDLKTFISMVLLRCFLSYRTKTLSGFNRVDSNKSIGRNKFCICNVATMDAGSNPSAVILQSDAQCYECRIK